MVKVGIPQPAAGNPGGSDKWVSLRGSKRAFIGLLKSAERRGGYQTQRPGKAINTAGGWAFREGKTCKT